MKRTFRQSARRAKTPVVWHVNGTDDGLFSSSSWQQAAVVVTPGIYTLGLLAASRRSSEHMVAGLFGNERMRVERVRGTVCLHANALDTVVAMGITVVKEVAGGGSYDQPDPIAANDAVRSWLWLGVRLIRTSSVGGPNNYVLNVDVKSRRILRPDEALVFMLRVNTAGGGESIRTVIQLRTLYSKIV